MRKILIAVILIFANNIPVILGQCKIPVFIGIQPNITVERFYEKGEFDVNICPIIIEASVSKRIDLKLSPIINYHFGGLGNGVSDVGLFTVLPVFFKKKEQGHSKPSGFYIGPVFGFGRNLLNKHFTTTLAVEPGYMFQTKKHFTISMGLQLGGSYFSYDSKPNMWVSHFGPKVSFGFWL